MDFTGERYIPSQGWASIAYEHLGRYLFAAPFAAGRDVLDLGSGDGYGAHLLAATARAVTGVDISEEAVAHARARYLADRTNLSYVRSPATVLPFADASFDLVTCFELLEHLAEQQELLTEVRRVLRPGGLLLVSTPNKRAYSDEVAFENEYHVKELYLEEFEALLAGVFGGVRLFAQRNVAGTLIAPLDEERPQPLAIRRIHRKNHQNEFAPVAGPAPSDHVYYLALCTDDPATLDGVTGTVVADRDDRWALESGEVAHARHLAYVAERDVADAQAARARAEEGRSVDELTRLSGGLAAQVEGELRRARSRAWDDVEPEQGLYDLVIPVFNSRKEVEVCLDTLLATTNHRHRIVLVDDASTDPKVGPLLQSYARKWKHISYTRLPKNLGFPGAVNTGLTHTKHDVVLVNSDTEFAPGWLARLDRCRRSDPRIGTVTPLSNNATVCSVPQMNVKNHLPRGVTVADMARLVAETSLRRYPRVPTGVGYCMLVTRAMIDAIGGIDMAFGRGYGEEVDWCQRGWAKGFESVLCDDAYVFHHGEVGHSEFADKRALQEANEREVGRRWPTYHRTVRAYSLMNPLRLQHQRLFERLRAQKGARARVLQVVHSFGVLAGTELHTRLVVDGTRRHVASTVLHPKELPPWYDANVEEEPGGLLRIEMNRGLLPVTDVFRGAPADVRGRTVERFFAEVVAGTEADVVHFQHLQNYGSFLLPAIARDLNRRVVMSLHDYFLLCPDWNLVGPDGRLCGRACATPSDECVACLERKRGSVDLSKPFDMQGYLARRHLLARTALEAADVLVAPSAFVRTQFRQAFGDALASRIQVIPHGTEPYPFRPAWRPAAELRVAFLGNMSTQKGRAVFLEAVRRMRGRNVRFTVLGDYAAAPDLAAVPELRFHGRYEPQELPQLLQDVDVAFIGSVWHETYCYTVDEAWRAGVPVVATRVGAIQERVRDGETGLVVPPSDADALVAALTRLADDRSLLLHLRERVAGLRLKTRAENMAEYEGLYLKLAALPQDKTEIVRALMKGNAQVATKAPITLEEYLAGVRPTPTAPVGS